MAESITYPFIPKSNAKLRPGQFWAIPLSDGRFACGRVLRVDRGAGYGGRTWFVAGLLDWVGTELPTVQSIAGASLLEVGEAHIGCIQRTGGRILGERGLKWDRIVVPDDVSSSWSMNYPTERAERRFVQGDPPPEWAIRDVSSPLTEDMLEPFTAETGQVQFSSLLTEGDFARLAEWLRDYPQLTLRAYGSYDGSIKDLEFLRFFPFVRWFGADFLYDSLETLDGLRHLPQDCEALTIGWTERRLDLGILRRFRNLTFLNLEGQTKGIEVLADLKSLEELTLRSVTLPDLSLLLPLKKLLALDIKLGGTKDLSLLPSVGRLRYLELWMIKGLTDVSSIGRLPRLTYLFLQALRRAAELPDLSQCVELRRIHLETMKGIRDLGPLATAPALEELLLLDMPHLQPNDLTCLVGHPRLKALTAELGSLKKNEAAQRLLGLPETADLKVGWREL